MMTLWSFAVPLTKNKQPNKRTDLLKGQVGSHPSFLRSTAGPVSDKKCDLPDFVDSDSKI